MKSTGIIRRIDDLGRVVIPKEIRRTMRLTEGDPMEIFTENGMVCFQKYEGELELRADIQKLINRIDFDYGMENVSEIKSKLKEALALIKSE